MEPKEKVKLRINPKLCSGCGICRLLCALVNHRENNPKLAHVEIVGQFPAPGGYKIKFKDCLRCGECAQIYGCPTGAITLKVPTDKKATENKEEKR